MAIIGDDFTQRYLTPLPRMKAEMTPGDQAIAAALHRRAQRIVDRVVAEAMENVRKELRKHDHRAMAG